MRFTLDCVNNIIISYRLSIMDVRWGTGFAVASPASSPSALRVVPRAKAERAERDARKRERGRLKTEREERRFARGPLKIRKAGAIAVVGHERAIWRSDT